MHTDSNNTKHWFSKRWESQHSGSGEISRASLSTIVDSILRKFAPSILFHEKVITDLKGRDEGQVLLSSYRGEEQPKSQEILYLSAYFETPEKSFTYRLHTSFEAFEGRHITHAVTEKRSFLMPLFLKPWLLGYCAPLTITHFRFGLERYENLFKALSFGYTPEVTERLLVDYHEGNLAFLMSSENLPDSETLPFQQIAESQHLLSLLQQA